MSFITQVSALIIKGDKVLMIKEKKPETQGGWNLPGGHIRLKERVVDAAVRETFEETGLNFIPESIIGIYTSCPDNHYYHFVVKGEIIEENLQSSPEDLESDWVSLTEITSRELRNAQRLEKIIDDYLSGFHIPLTVLKEELDI